MCLTNFLASNSDFLESNQRQEINDEMNVGFLHVKQARTYVYTFRWTQLISSLCAELR